MIIAARPKSVGLAVVAALAIAVAPLAQEVRPADARLAEADAHFSRLEYEQALAAYRQARASDDARVRVAAGTGVTRVLLRLGLFEEAGLEGAAVASRDPATARAIAIHGDALWAAGLFEEAEARQAEALAIDPRDTVALHGRARSLSAQSKLSEALEAARRAVAASPADPEYLYTLASIHERLRDFPAAVGVLDRFISHLPQEDLTHLVRWARAQQRLLANFGRRTPIEVVNPQSSYTMPVRIVGNRVLVDGVVNGRTAVEFALDTGADQTILTPAVASRAGVSSVAAVQSAGVGGLGLGFRDLQLARVAQVEIGGLRMRQVPAVIKDPALAGLPRPEGAGFSPLVLGFSMVLDYQARRLTLARTLPAMTHAVTLRLRVPRLPIVRVMVDSLPAGFAIDTASDANGLSRRLARRLEVDSDVPLVAARVFGSAGQDPTAFLLPFVRLSLGPGIRTAGESIVVLNLDAPSGLLGVNLGGILGHDFLSRYRLTIDLARSQVGFDPAGPQ